MKRTALTFFLASLASTAVFANDASLPSVNDYIYKSPTPAQRFSQRFRGYYLKLNVEHAQINVNDIKNTSTLPPGDVPFPVNQTSANSRENGIIVAIGYNWAIEGGPPFRLELNYAHRSALDYDADPVFNSGDTAPIDVRSTVQIKTLTLNSYFNFRDDKLVSPYLGFGIGAAFNTVKGTSTLMGNTRALNDTETDFSWNLQAGINFNISKHMILNLGYMYSDAGKAEWGNLAGNASASENDSASIESTDIKINSLQAGITLTP